MMEASARTKFVAGVFLMAVMLAFSGMILFMQSWAPEPQGHEYWVELESAPDLSVQSPVMVGAQQVGTITNIEIRTVESEVVSADGVRKRPLPKVYLQIFVETRDDRDFRIHANAIATVVTKLFGSATLNLDPGYPTPEAPQPLAPGAMIRGSAVPSMGDLMAKGIETMETLQPTLAKLEPMMLKFSRTIDSLQSIANSVEAALQPIGNQEFGQRIDAISVNIEVLTKNLEQVSRDLQPMVTRINETVTSLSSLVDGESENVRAIIANARDMSESLASLTASAQNDVLPKVNGILDEVQTLTAKGNAFINDNAEEVRRTIHNISEITDDFRQNFAARLETILQRSEETLTNIARMSAKADGIVTENRSSIRQILISLRETMDGVKATVIKLQRDPSIMIWGTDNDDNAADVRPGSPRSIEEEKKLRDSGRLPPRERD